ncbi:MAG: hypothetical protein U9N59_05200, partial [Campylobacterota bacterium]|nr:hypothetical protein [Campylobacterota bacterium]
MKTKLRTLALSTVAAAILTGCGGVDEERLAELTGDKNFEQVKISYVTALALEKREDMKIYEHWLKENGKLAQPTFNFENYKTKINTEYEKQITIFEKKMTEISTKTDALIAKHKKN